MFTRCRKCLYLSVLLVLLPLQAHARSCGGGTQTLEEAYAAADSVVVGLVAGCESLADAQSAMAEGRECWVSPIEVLKAATPARDYSSAIRSSACRFSLETGSELLLFLDSENNPVGLSANLSGEHAHNRRANLYLQILRDYKLDRVADLSEPWIFVEHEGMCLLGHRVGNDEIMFIKRGPDATSEFSLAEWTEETADGQTVYKSVTSTDHGQIEYTTTGEPLKYDADMLLLMINIYASDPSTVQRATISVGTETWDLQRIETAYINDGRVGTRTVSHHARGVMAQEILTAMVEPADMTVLSIGADAEGIDVLPSPVQFQSRSTQLANSINEFRGCFAMRE